jgi:hypothetical protein
VDDPRIIPTCQAACIWHNWATAGPVKRSLTAYDN